MTETQCIIEAYRRATSENAHAALATVVRVEGSAYRRPGARMLVTEDGRTTGVVSGGCLEGDVRRRAARVMHTGQPTLVTYDTSNDENVVRGLGLGCSGVVDVLIEPASESLDRLVQFLFACSHGQQRAAFATVIRSEGIAEVAVGTRLFLLPDGNLEVFIEAVEPPLPLVIFGAGADAVPLVTIAQRLGWLATVVDTHARARSLERFADADRSTVTHQRLAMTTRHRWPMSLGQPASPAMLPRMMTPDRFAPCRWQVRPARLREGKPNVRLGADNKGSQ
jgi:xanthine/CO dehydrogenase XdhC/CoxF family maturation factor